MDAGQLQKLLKEQSARLGLPGEVLQRALETEDWFLVQEWAIPRRGSLPAGPRPS